MTEVLNYGIMGISMSFAHVFSWYYLDSKKMNFKNYKLYVSLLVNAILLLIGALFIDKILRIVYVTLIFMIVNYYLMRQNVKKTMLLTVFTQIIIMLAETFIALILSIMKVDLGQIANDRFGGTINLAVSICVILIEICFNFLPKIYQLAVKETDKINSEYFISFGFISILIANISAKNIYYEAGFNYMLIFNTLVTIVYFIIIIHSFSNRNNYLKIYDKYNTTLSSLKEYEDIFNRYRISNHENKNQLLTIRNMVKNKEKHIPEYIDKIVENKLKDNEYLMGKSMIIPEGGLRGLIYSKMLVMKEKNIDFDLSIDKAIRTVQLIELGDQSMLDIYRVMGVFLDNAIEAVEDLQEKFIDLEMRIENQKLYISVTNNFCGNVDLEQMDKIGYSTKGKNHGYGLALVKEIVEENKLLKHKKEIMADEFIQTILIDISKLKGV